MKIVGRFLVLVLTVSLSGAVQAVSRVPLIAPRSRPSRAADRILVKFRPQASNGMRAQAMSAQGLTMKSEIAGIGLQVLQIPTGETPESMIARLHAKHPDTIEYAEVDHYLYPVLTPNDPLFLNQYHLTKISAPAAWDQTTGSGVIIAIADTGVQASHPDLAAHLRLPGYNSMDGTSDIVDYNGHGTAVAGTAAAIGNNAVDGSGVAFNATILPIKITLGADTSGTSDDEAIAAAIMYAADHGAKVVNVSFGSDTSCDSQTMINAANYMISKGGLVVQAAGNSPINKGCPTNTSIIEVSATDQNDALAFFSNFGSDIAVSAPGVSILTTNCNNCSIGNGLGDVALYDGTSFSAPIAAGVVALIYAIDRNFTAAQAQQILFNSADDIGNPGYDIDFGWGRVNAAKAVTLAAQTAAITPLATPVLGSVFAYPNPWDTRLETQRLITFANIPPGATVKIFNLAGLSVKTLPNGAGNTIPWDLTNAGGQNVASGLYFYEVSGGAIGKPVVGKIAIIK